MQIFLFEKQIEESKPTISQQQLIPLLVFTISLFVLFFFFSSTYCCTYSKLFILSLYLWVHMSKSFFLPSTISSKKSSSCPTILSVPHLNTPNQLFKLSTLSWISPPPPSYSNALSNCTFSSSVAALAFLNSYSRIPGCPSMRFSSAATLCCNLEVETMKLDPNTACPSCPPWQKLDLGQQ